MTNPFAKDAARKMRKELADLEADQAKATCWGAAVGERGKRIAALRRELARQTDTPNETDTSAEAVERHTELMLRYNLIDAVKCMDALAADRIRALEAQMGRVTVKPLEWVVGSARANCGDHEAQTMLGTYSCRKGASSKWRLWKNERLLSEEEYPTIEAAKAAAQADYERRILSALSPAPVTVRDDDAV